MNIKFIICIILGIILYILINKIEGLRCRGPLDDALGDSDPSARIDKLNRGSLPFFPKNNVMVARRVDGRNVHIIRTSRDERPYNDGTTFELKCSTGLKDERQEKLAPYESRNPDYSPSLTCHNPSKKAIFYNIHSTMVHGVVRPMFGSKRSDFTQIPKKMQLIFYINNGNCYANSYTDRMLNVKIMFSDTIFTNE